MSSAWGQDSSWTGHEPIGLIRIEDTVSDVPVADDAETPLRRYKWGAVQKLSVGSGWVGGGGDDLNVANIRTSIGLGVPLGSFQNILGVEPSFQVDFPSAPAGVDLPSELYDFGVRFFWRRDLNDRWGVMTIVSPSYRSDLTAHDGAVRVFALALLTYDWIPDRLSISGGAVALGRADIPVVPALGLRWTPHPRLRFDVNFPRPRISYRFRKQGSESESWAYLEGALGGNTWAVTRADGTSDDVSIRDLRLALGFEHLLDGGSTAFLECGYAFNRRVEYGRTGQSIDFGDGILTQFGLSW